MTLSKRQILYICLSFAIMVFIFVQSALPADLSQEESNFLVPFVMKLFQISADSASFLIRKTAHFTEYAILGASLSVTVNSLWKVKSVDQNTAFSDRPGTAVLLKTGLIAFGIGAAYAVTDEIHQRFVEGRSCEVRDMMIDFGGVLLGVLIISLIKRLRMGSKNKKRPAEHV